MRIAGEGIGVCSAAAQESVLEKSDFFTGLADCTFGYWKAPRDPSRRNVTDPEEFK
jgi:hypothetical protein